MAERLRSIVVVVVTTVVVASVLVVLELGSSAPTPAAASPPGAAPQGVSVSSTDDPAARWVSWDRWQNRSDDPVPDEYVIQWGTQERVVAGTSVGAEIAVSNPADVVNVSVAARIDGVAGPAETVSSDPATMPTDEGVPGLAAVPTDSSGELEVSWTEASTASVEVRWPGHSTTVDPEDPTTLTIPGLTDGTPVTVTARRVEANGLGPVEVATEMAPGTPTGKPGSVTVAPGELQGTIEVSWAPIDSEAAGVGGPVTGYRVTWPGGEESAEASDTSFVALNVPVGRALRLEVAAVNAYGPGARTQSDEVTPTGPPTAGPPGVIAEATSVNGRVRITWEELPAEDAGGLPINGYEVQAGDIDRKVEGPLVRETYLNGLPDGVPTTVRVKAANAFGTGVATEVQATPVGPPVDAPTGVSASATADSGTLSVSWETFAGGDGGSEITGYVVQAGTEQVEAEADDTAAEIDGLVDGEVTEVTVSARNGRGTGPGSDPVTAIPGVPIAAPSSVHATVASPTSVRVRWAALDSEDAGASPVTRYVISWPGGSAPADAEDTEVVIPDLVPGTPYRFQVRAENVNGPGPDSETTPEVPLGAPTAAPSGLTAEVVGTPGTVSLSWDALDPEDEGVQAITAYVVRSDEGVEVVAPATATTVDFSGLYDGAPRTFKIAAVNPVGQGPWSVMTEPVVPFGPPTGYPPNALALTDGVSGTVEVSWGELTEDGGSEITGYKVSWPGDSIELDVSARAFQITGMEDGVEAEIFVAGENAAGYGPANGPLVVTPGQRPTRFVENVAAEPTGVSGQLRISWDPLANEDIGTGPITDYAIWGLGDEPILADGDADELIVDGLVNGRTYWLGVSPVSPYGWGPASEVVTAAPETSPIQAPTGVVARTTDVPGQVKVLWNLLSPEGWGGVEGTYVLTHGSLSQEVFIRPDAIEPVTVTGLPTDAPTTFTVRAKNSYGIGPESSPSRPVTPTGRAPKPNLLANADLERAVEGWVGSRATIRRSVITSFDGVASLEVTTDDAMGGAPPAVSTLGSGRGIDVTPGRSYEGRVHVAAASDANEVVPMFVWWDAQGRWLDVTFGEQTSEEPMAWTEIAMSSTVAPPDAKTLSLVVLYPTSPRGERHFIDAASIIDVTDAPSMNLLTADQATIETGASAWVPLLATASRQPGYGHEGMTALLVKAQNSEFTGPFTGVATKAQVELDPGDEVSFRTAALVGGEGQRVRLATFFFNEDDVFQDADITDPEEDLPPGEWTVLEHESVVPAGSSRVAFGVLVSEDEDDDTLIDSASAWVGGLDEPDAVDLLSEPDRGFETDQLGWMGIDAQVGPSPDTVRQGLLSMRIGNDNGGFAAAYSDMGVHGAPIRPNRSYTASVWVRPRTTPRAGGLVLVWFDEDGNLIPDMPHSNPFPERANDWTQMQLTADAPPEARYAAMGAIVPGGEPGEVHYLDEALLCEGTSPDCVGEQGPVSRPTDVVATAVDGSAGTVEVSWDPVAPEDVLAEEISGYEVTWGDGDPLSVEGGDSDSVVIEELSPGSTLTFAVAAVNPFGPGKAVAAAPVRVITPPVDAPDVTVAVTGESGQLHVSWDPPEDDGGRPLIDYVVRWGEDGDDAVVGAEDVEFFIEGLVNAEPVSVTVAARNSMGEGPRSEPITKTPGQKPTAAPTDVTAEDTGVGGEVHVAWTPIDSEDVGTGALDGYVVRSGDDVLATAGVGETEVDVDGRTNGQPLDLTVAAISAYGRGPSSSTVTVTPTGPPSVAPTGVTARSTGTAGQVVVEWSPYKLYGFEGKLGTAQVERSDGYKQVLSVSSAATGRVVLAGMPSTTPFTYRLRVINANGEGPWSAASRPVTASARAVYPNLLGEKQNGFEDAELGWTSSNGEVERSVAAGRNSLVSLRVKARTADGVIAVSGTGADAIPVTPGTEYRASAWVSVLDDPGSAQVHFAWFDANGFPVGQPGSYGGDIVDEVPMEWTAVSSTATAPPGAVTAAVAVIFPTTGAGQSHLVDDVAFSETTELASNLLTASRSTFETGGPEWVTRNAHVARSATAAATGYASLKMVTETPMYEGDAPLVALAPEAGMTPVTPGDTYRLTASLRSEDVDGAFGAFIFFNEDGLPFDGPFPTAVQLGDDWSPLSAEHTAPPGAVSMTVMIGPDGAQAGDVLFMDDVAIRKVVDGDPVGSNLISEEASGFETSPLGWLAMAGAVGQGVEYARHGLVSLRLTEGLPAEEFPYAEFEDDEIFIISTDGAKEGAPVVAGRRYTASVWARPGEGSPAGHAAVVVAFFDAAGNELPLDPSDIPVPAPETTEDWIQLSTTAVAPDDAAYAAVQVAFTGEIGSIHHLDDVALCQGWSPDCVAEQAPTSRPTGAKADVTSEADELTVSWDAYDIDQIERENVEGFRVTGPNGPVDVPGSSSDEVVIDGLTPGEPVTFTVVAYNQGGESPPSKASYEVTPGTPPTALTGLTGVGALDGDITLSWDALDPDAGGGASVTTVEVWGDDGDHREVDPEDTTVTIGGFAGRESVNFEIRLVNANGPSIHTAKVSVDVPGTTVTLVDLPEGSLLWETETIKVDVPRRLDVDAVELLVDDEAVDEIAVDGDDPTDLEFELDTEEIEDGDHTIAARATFGLGGDVTSAATTVEIANASGSIDERLKSELDRNEITVEEFVENGVNGSIDEQQVPPRYRSAAGAQPTEDATGAVFSYLSAGDAAGLSAEARDRIIGSLAFQATPALPQQQAPDTTLEEMCDDNFSFSIPGGPSVSVGSGWCRGTYDVDWDLPPLDFYFQLGDSEDGMMSPYDGPDAGAWPDYIDQVVGSFEIAADVYQHDLGMAFPDEPGNIPVIINGDRGYTNIFFKKLIQIPPVAQQYSTPRHEMFHYFSYNYLSEVDVGSGAIGDWGRPSTLWWMEASASWGDHAVIEKKGLPASMQTDEYYDSLDEFLREPGDKLTRAGKMTKHGIAGEGSARSYGSYVVPEFLEATREGGDKPSFVTRVYEYLDGKSKAEAARAIDDVLQEDGVAMGTFLQDFWRATYLLTTRKDGGRSLGYNELEGTMDDWRLSLDSNRTNGDDFSAKDRPQRLHETVDLEEHPDVDYTRNIKFGGANFLDFEVPDDETGRINVEYEVADGGQQGEKVAFGLMSYEGSYPKLCRVSNPDGNDTDIPLIEQTEQLESGYAPALGGMSSDSEDGHGTVSINVDPTCNNATLVIVDMDPDSNYYMEQNRYTIRIEYEGEPSHGGPIDNGHVELGINPLGNLIRNNVGLRYIGGEGEPWLAEGLAWGCACEGWGIADTEGLHAGVSAARGIAGPMAPISFTRSGTTVTSKTRVGAEPGGLDVTHRFTPARDSAGVAIPELYQVKISVTNRQSEAREVYYRRTSDWDVPPNVFNEYVTLGGSAPWLRGMTTDGFVSPDPYAPICGYTLCASGPGTDYGPYDIGTAFEVSLGTIPSGGTKTMTMYYGVATNETDAMTAIYRSGSQVWGLAESNISPLGGEPYSFIIGFKQ